MPGLNSRLTLAPLLEEVEDIDSRLSRVLKTSSRGLLISRSTSIGDEDGYSTLTEIRLEANSGISSSGSLRNEI